MIADLVATDAEHFLGAAALAVLDAALRLAGKRTRLLPPPPTPRAASLRPHAAALPLALCAASRKTPENAGVRGHWPRRARLERQQCGVYVSPSSAAAATATATCLSQRHGQRHPPTSAKISPAAAHPRGPAPAARSRAGGAARRRPRRSRAAARPRWRRPAPHRQHHRRRHHTHPAPCDHGQHHRRRTLALCCASRHCSNWRRRRIGRTARRAGARDRVGNGGGAGGGA
jgi:hypothetical protein